MSRRLRVRGFTLLEILVVIVIIAAVTAISPPLWSSGVSSAEHRAVTRAIAQTLRYARSEAVANRTDVGVEFNLQEHVYQLPGGKRQGKWPPTMELELVTTAAETVDEQRAFVRFYADGGSTGGRVTLKVKDRAYRVDINWLTGHVSIDDA
ncbi:MAG: GspH/FimT family pseudopilin [Burkholderiales bacterium]|nr:GspH/FimT family pseudopilin [Burkholderiales bacterium]